MIDVQYCMYVCIVCMLRSEVINDECGWLLMEPAGGHSEERTSTGRLQLHGEVMACGYEDVQVMWFILDMKSNPCTTTAALTS